MICRVCGHEMKLLETLRGKEKNVTSLYKKAFVGKKENVDLYRCSLCTHMQIDWTNPADYYDSYTLIAEPTQESEYGRYSPALLSYYEEKFQALADYAVDKDNIIDIGCGCGVLMDLEARHFEKPFGVEPSKVQYDIAKKLRKNVINGYFSRELNLAKESWSAFVSTQVFEHITNISEVLGYAYDLLKWGGVGLIEVPNGQKVLFERCYYDVYSDHVNYFTPTSLCMLAEKTGFEIISVSEEFNRNHMSIYVRKKKTPESFCSVINDDMAALNRICNKYGRISVWGVGGKARSFIQLVEQKDSIKHFWDINALLWGFYLDSAKAPITKPTKEEVLDSDLILIFAAAYTEEIMQELTAMGYRGDVVRFDGKVMVAHI